jgi:hypothetical protein
MDSVTTSSGTLDARLFSSATSPGTIHTLTVTASNETALQGDSVNFTIHAPSGIAPVNYTWVFGDGLNASSTNDTVAHTYASAGQYVVYVQAKDAGGILYDNLAALMPFVVQSSYIDDTAGNLALLDGAVQQNSTSNHSAQAVISPGGSVLVANWIDVGPSSPFWHENLPFYSLSSNVVPFAILSTPVLNLSGIDAEAVSFSNITPFGSYDLSFGETTTTSQGGVASAASSFTFTMFVATGAVVAAHALPTSPHPGTLNVYATAINLFGADPATDYDAPGYTVDDNVYQTLVAFNGSEAGPDPSDYVPDLATCVPGPECQGMYGTSLITSNGDWTFVINPNATFFNITTGAHYPVTPNDVEFSFARSCLTADYPGLQLHSTWVLCQALVPSATSNRNWDSGLHYPYNTTPANILASMTLNDSAYCTPLMEDGVHGAGCVTLHTGLSANRWPELLTFVAGPEAGSVISCRWATAEGYGLPGWESGNACLGAPPSPAPQPTDWDSSEVTQGAFHDVNSPLAYHAVGSGPYTLRSVGPSGSQFQLTANPYWSGTTCVGGLREGCLPPAPIGGIPDYIGTVNVFLNGTTANQTVAVLNGTADLAGLQTPVATSFVADEFRHGLLQFIEVPTIVVFLPAMNMDVNVTLAQNWTTTPLSFPSDLMADLNFRQFLIHSFPTPSLEAGCITNGLESCFQAGGAIPAYMTPYYPDNISWFLGTPDGNPTDVGGAGWWWNQTASDGLDGQTCTTSSPCTFPMVVPYGQSSVFQEWATEIRAISQGAADPVVVIGSNTTFLYRFYTQAYSGGGGMPLYASGWAPDYFDPSDYTGPYYTWNITGSSYAYGNSANITLTQNSSFTSPCAGPAPDPTVTLSCQGSAYHEMTTLIYRADGCTLPSCSPSQRALLYNMAENIADSLALYGNAGQSASVFVAGPWIDTTTISRNPFEAGYGIPFYYVAYRGSVPYGYPLVVSPVADPLPPDGGSSAASQLAPSIQTASPATVTIEAGETVVFSVSAAGGSGVYHFDWTGLPPGCASTNSPFVVCSPNGSAETTVGVVVTDSRGGAALATGLGLSVVAHVKIQSLVLTPLTVVVGDTVTIQANEIGGLSPFTFSYLGLPAGCSSANSSTLVCTPSVVGTYSIVAQVVDRIGITALGSASLIVTSSTSGPLTVTWTEAVILAASTGVAGFVIGAAVFYAFSGRRKAFSKSPPPSNPPPPGPSG